MNASIFFQIAVGCINKHKWHQEPFDGDIGNWFEEDILMASNNINHSSIIIRLLQSHHKPRDIVLNRVNIKALVFVFIYLYIHCSILIRDSTKTNGVVKLNYRMIFSETMIYRYCSNTQYRLYFNCHKHWY